MSKTAVVTGASSGIGRATAALFLAQGYTVIGTSRDPERIPAANRIDGVEYRALDLADAESIEAFGTGLPAVDVLVNNAGESQSGPLEELPADALDRLFRINVLGPVRLTQLVLPGMRERGAGRVIMVGSMLASFPLAYRSSYVATKAALKGFAHAARLEVSPFGVAISTVEPGSIATGIGERRTAYIAADSAHLADYRTMISKLDHNEQNGIAAEQVAALIVKVARARRPKPLYATGSRAPLVFALRRLLPAAAIHRITARAHGLKR
ncbi:SDR family oxidoreductase [Nocardia sp. NPDC057227]|uniref:SDR family oxidoreductase n=1 Tax=Nocardia sp. NPDC057227 TaxID=3346056 RepID=UPI003625786D